MIGSCHCSSITIRLTTPINLVTSCNCSICRRCGAIWAYFEPTEVIEETTFEYVSSYSHGDKCIEFHHCRVCGSLTHYTPTERGNKNRMAVNLRVFDPTVITKVNMRYFDGAESWQFYEK